MVYYPSSINYVWSGVLSKKVSLKLIIKMWKIISWAGEGFSTPTDYSVMRQANKRNISVINNAVMTQGRSVLPEFSFLPPGNRKDISTWSCTWRSSSTACDQSSFLSLDWKEIFQSQQNQKEINSHTGQELWPLALWVKCEGLFKSYWTIVCAKTWQLFWLSHQAKFSIITM